MTLAFNGETVLGVVGTVIVETRVTDGSFTHEFGTEVIEDLEWLVGGFVPDKEFTALDGQLMRALWNWIDANEQRIERAFLKACRDE